jgi:hypothetical protein
LGTLFGDRKVPGAQICARSETFPHGQDGGLPGDSWWGGIYRVETLHNFYLDLNGLGGVT